MIWVDNNDDVVNLTSSQEREFVFLSTKLWAWSRERIPRRNTSSSTLKFNRFFVKLKGKVDLNVHLKMYLSFCCQCPNWFGKTGFENNSWFSWGKLFLICTSWWWLNVWHLSRKWENNPRIVCQFKKVHNSGCANLEALNELRGHT